MNISHSNAIRRSQNERSEAMRARLIEATLQSLIQEGYAKTIISKIIQIAQVSRGSPVHHFPSKAALMESTAEQLVRRIYIALGKLIKNMQQSDDRLHDLVSAGANLLKTPEITALLELLVASRQEPELAEKLQKLWMASYHTVHSAAAHYLEPITEQDHVGDLMIITLWFLRGMAEDRHLSQNIQQADEFFNRYIQLWTSILANHLQAKVNVSSPPPKPVFWDHLTES